MDHRWFQPHIYKDEDKNNWNLIPAMMGRFSNVDQWFIVNGNTIAWSQNSHGLICKISGHWLSWIGFYVLGASFPRLSFAKCRFTWLWPLSFGFWLLDNKTGKPRFRFESFWPKKDDFQGVSETSWNSTPATWCPFNNLARKIRAMAKGLQSWEQKKIGHVNNQLGMAREIVHNT